MDKFKWDKYKQQKFIDELKDLCDRHNIHSILNLNAGHRADESFYVYASQIYFYTDAYHQQKDDVESAKRAMIDSALDTGNRELFDSLMSDMYVDNTREIQTVQCVDCTYDVEDDHLHCKICGKPMCDECYRIGNGTCGYCEEKHFKFGKGMM